MHSFYCYNGTGLNHDPFIALLESNNFKNITNLSNVNYVDFMWVEQVNDRFDKNSYTINTYLKNILNDEKEKLTNKEKLYENLKNHNQEIAKLHMAESLTLKPDIISSLKKNEMYIIKPVGAGACSGKDIIIIKYDNPKQIYDSISYLKRYKSSIICNYISNVDLFNSKKYHLRMYLLIRAKTKTLPAIWSFHKTGKILTAELPYKMSDFHNKKIHDTHMDSTDDDYFYPDDMKKSKSELEYLNSQMIEICKNCFEIVSESIKGFDETKTAFEVFGLDFLVDANNKVYLLELNDKVGYESTKNKKFPLVPRIYTDKFTQFSKEFFEWVYKYGIKDIMEEKSKFIDSTF